MRETTAARLKQIMSEQNLRQVDIVRLCQPYCVHYNLRLTKSDLSQFISGKVTPGQWKISILSRALDVNEAWLMGYDVPRARATEEQKQFVEDAFALNKKLDSAQEAVELFSDLSPEEIQRVRDFVAGLKASRKA